MQQETVQQTGIQSSNQPFVASQGQVSQGQPIMTAPLAGQPVIAGPSSDQPIMYQMPPGQLQPMSPGMPTVSAQGQPGVQYYISAGGQPVQHVPQVQPIPQIVHPIPGQGIPNNLAQHHDPEMAPIRFNKAYMKSALGVSRVLEFVSIIVPLFWRKLHLTNFEKRNTNSCVASKYLSLLFLLLSNYHVHHKGCGYGWSVTFWIYLAYMAASQAKIWVRRNEEKHNWKIIVSTSMFLKNSVFSCL